MKSEKYRLLFPFITNGSQLVFFTFNYSFFIYFPRAAFQRS